MAAAILAFTALFIGLDIAERPIALWDESRLAVNALEMRQRGFSLVTTYGFAPDLWNTKPPLLIWLQAGAIDLFGAREWAIRLPSLLAAVATAGLTLRFAWRLSASLFVMAIAGLALVVSGGFYGYHAAMTGDYDALLALFVTGYLLLLFELLHRRRPSAVPVIACGLLVAAACLTKGVAGLVPGAGVAVYVLARWRWRRLFETPWYGLAALLAVAIVGGFYAAREATAAGYLGAVMTNELGGRYLHGLGGHTWPAYYYPQMLAELFAFGPAFALPLLATALPWRRTPSVAIRHGRRPTRSGPPTICSGSRRTPSSTPRVYSTTRSVRRRPRSGRPSPSGFAAWTRAGCRRSAAAKPWWAPWPSPRRTRRSR